MSRYYNPLIARFISEDTYRGELNDPLSLNRYVYVNNNPLIYYDPNGYFLKESLEWVGVRAVTLVHGTAELAYDTAVGTFNLGWKTGEFIGSGIGLAGNYAAYQSGLTSEDTYNYLHDSYLKTFTKSGETLANLPGNMVNGIVNNFKTTFNMDNLNAYLDSNASYDTIKNYSKSVIQTGATIYGGYELGKAVYNKITGPSSSGVMSKADILDKNKTQGKIFEEQEFTKFSNRTVNAEEQITIKTYQGTKIRVDAIGIDSQTGNLVINEFKSSTTAPLTQNQKIGFPDLYQSGGNVVGNGKNAFTGGYKIPKGINVQIVRPNK